MKHFGVVLVIVSTVTLVAAKECNRYSEEYCKLNLYEADNKRMVDEVAYYLPRIAEDSGLLTTDIEILEVYHKFWAPGSIWYYTENYVVIFRSSRGGKTKACITKFFLDCPQGACDESTQNRPVCRDRVRQLTDLLTQWTQPNSK